MLAVAFSVSFGLLARTAGMGALAPIVMSATTLAGSAQFAVASVLDDAGGAVAAIVAAACWNARLRAAEHLGRARLRRATLATAARVTDDRGRVVGSLGPRRRPFDAPVLVGAGLTLFPAGSAGRWSASSGGELLGDPERLGLDAAFPALFLALLVPQGATARPRQPALPGAAIALVLVPGRRRA